MTYIFYMLKIINHIKYKHNNILWRFFKIIPDWLIIIFNLLIKHQNYMVFKIFIFQNQHLY